ncbi:hypothetical protein BN938_0789 [Mucinivorans hirudinis]|uniref:Uncharacterized protein n=1 Tax=Mucinivorans hirudinis TaxID=1433126 RepID=A0A060RAU8_9BACT|nr:hypothetical protein BN938_0789 [Mucinivorans hirudinis]
MNITISETPQIRMARRVEPQKYIYGFGSKKFCKLNKYVHLCVLKK